jgi:hypothetical protein
MIEAKPRYFLQLSPETSENIQELSLSNESLISCHFECKSTVQSMLYCTVS